MIQTQIIIEMVGIRHMITYQFIFLGIIGKIKKAYKLIKTPTKSQRTGRWS